MNKSHSLSHKILLPGPRTIVVLFQI